MTELNKKTKDKVSIVKQQQEELQVEHDSTIVPHSNHTLFEINTKTGYVKKAVFNYETTLQGDWQWKPGTKLIGNYSLIKNPDCVYISALTQENAWKHFKNNSTGTKFINEEPLSL
jgi:hypothetical protein